MRNFSNLTWIMIGDLTAAAASITALHEDDDTTLTAGIANPFFFAAWKSFKTLSPVITPVPISSRIVGYVSESNPVENV